MTREFILPQVRCAVHLREFMNDFVYRLAVFGPSQNAPLSRFRPMRLAACCIMRCQRVSLFLKIVHVQDHLGSSCFLARSQHNRFKTRRVAGGMKRNLSRCSAKTQLEHDAVKRYPSPRSATDQHAKEEIRTRHTQAPPF